MMQKGGLEIHHLSVEQFSDYREEKSDANSSYTKLMFLFQKKLYTEQEPFTLFNEAY